MPLKKPASPKIKMRSGRIRFVPANFFLPLKVLLVPHGIYLTSVPCSLGVRQGIVKQESGKRSCFFYCGLPGVFLGCCIVYIIQPEYRYQT